ncbi:class I SAM-dependent methyltransferase [Desulfovibrio sp. OttesenSCG-928-I05]|nr:class I SAM-dependent methyltransferase [Desulfovibrio sp. OttesenSCG-928-I05]
MPTSNAPEKLRTSTPASPKTGNGAQAGLNTGAHAVHTTGTIPPHENHDEYAIIAPWYDLVTARLLRPVRRRMVRLCRENGWGNMLDIGCGTGELLSLLHEEGIGARGIDNSPAMLAEARRRHPGMSGLTFAGLPAPFPDASFDAVILSLVLHESRDGGQAVLLEALRLAPQVMILEWRMPERNIDYPGQLITHSIERLAGKAHYARFRAFARAGWLRGLAYENAVRLVREEAVAGGLLTLAVAENAV